MKSLPNYLKEENKKLLKADELSFETVVFEVANGAAKLKNCWC